MAPEQLNGTGELDARVDVYGLGVTLFECVTLARPFTGESRETLALGERQPALVLVQRPVAALAGQVSGAIGRAAGGSLHQFDLAVGQAGIHHAVVQQRQQHRHQGGLLAAVEARRGGEGGGRLVDQGAAQPQLAGAVDEVLEGGGHVAEAGRAADGQAGAVAQVVEGGVDRPLVRDLGVDRLAGGRDRRHRAQARLDARARLHAGGEPLGHGAGGPMAGIEEDQHIGAVVGHGGSWVTWGIRRVRVSRATREPLRGGGR